tara:strand:- start:1812 stop:2456 length:645 start_codon:yes stop_codon:yes gene_type:complete
MKLSESKPAWKQQVSENIAKQYGGNIRPSVDHHKRTSLPGERQRLQKWDMIPSADFVQRVAGEFVRQNSLDLFKDKTAVIFSLPGAFTPVCSEKMLPAYEELYERFKQAGVDEIYCVSVNDGFVMNAWAESLGIKKVKMLADGNGDFTDAMGMLCSKRSKGFAMRSWRYSCLIKNNIIFEAFVEPGFNHKDEDDDPYEISDPETMIQFVEAENR